VVVDLLGSGLDRRDDHGRGHALQRLVRGAERAVRQLSTTQALIFVAIVARLIGLWVAASPSDSPHHLPAST
jgi:hypothetical protein